MQPSTRTIRPRVVKRSFKNIDDNKKKEKHRLVEAKGRGRRIQLFEKLDILLREIEKKLGREIPSEVLIVKDDLTDDRRKIKSNRKKYNNEDILRKVYVLIHISQSISAKKKATSSSKFIENDFISSGTLPPTLESNSDGLNYTVSHFSTPQLSPINEDFSSSISPLSELPNYDNSYTTTHSTLSELEFLVNLSVSYLVGKKNRMLLDLYYSSFDV
ncbi:hypothetical protein RB653_002646 [Dictyostelium firmibasis]|uniref:Uncharacterized protein n=1 Tax=Dictyostelium firmibasis TaxID=79012 RepID=A0AAN7YSX5_9MYCE